MDYNVIPLILGVICGGLSGLGWILGGVKHD